MNLKLTDAGSKPAEKISPDRSITVTADRKKTAGAVIRGIFTGRFPGQLVIQFTDLCNATCPQCGMNKKNSFKRNTLPGHEIKQAIDHAADNNFHSLSFTGGEPFIFLDDLAGYIDYATGRGIPYVRTGTNGFIFMNHEKTGFRDRIKRIAEKLASTKLYTFWISLDSACARTHEKMRGLKNVVAGIEKALPLFHQYGIYPAANLGINRNTGGYNEKLYKIAGGEKPFNKDEYYEIFRTSFRRFYSFITDMGFTITNACYPMSSQDQLYSDTNAVYQATSGDPIVSFSREEKVQLFKAFFDTIPEFRSKIRIFSPRSSLLSMIREYQGDHVSSYPCRGGIDYFFIDSKDGNTYPCGYRGNENMGQFRELNRNSIKSHAFCRKCDWECFRDPSTYLGPVSNPLSLIKKLFTDRQFIRLWMEDFLYARACDFYNGRSAPSYTMMKRFSIV